MNQKLKERSARYFTLAAISAGTFLISLRHGYAVPQPQLTVSVAPAAVTLPAGQEWAKVVYTFTNQTRTELEIKDRYAHFESEPPAVTTAVVGPFPTPLKVPAHGEISWPDHAFVSSDLVRVIVQNGALDQHKLVLVQSFGLVPNRYDITNVTAKVTFTLEYLAVTNFSTACYEVTALKDFTDDPQRRVRLLKLLEFADRAPVALSNVLGICPDLEKRIPLWIDRFRGFPNYNPNPQPHMSIPWQIVEQQEGIEFLFAVYPHELAHYFLMTRFPNPPKWFVEGPASFFGNKVTAALGHEESARHDKQKILGFADKYIQNHCSYCFEARWPEDTGHNDNPDDVHSYGFGYAYRICLELEELCGPDFFPKVFRHMERTGLDFTKGADEHAKNVMLIEAFQSQTGEDLWRFFEQKGFQRN